LAEAVGSARLGRQSKPLTEPRCLPWPMSVASSEGGFLLAMQSGHAEHAQASGEQKMSKSLPELTRKPGPEAACRGVASMPTVQVLYPSGRLLPARHRTAARPWRRTQRASSSRAWQSFCLALVGDSFTVFVCRAMQVVYASVRGLTMCCGLERRFEGLVCFRLSFLPV